MQTQFNVTEEREMSLIFGDLRGSDLYICNIQKAQT